MLRLLSQLLLFLTLLLGFKSVIWFIHQRYYPPDMCDIPYKSSQFDSLRMAYNTVFVGSSRTYMSLVPSQFDSLMGGSFRSYNYGIASLFAPHSFHLTESLLRRSDLHLTHLFVELSLPSTMIPEEPFRFNPLAEIGYRARLWQLRNMLTPEESWESWLNSYGLAVLSPQFPVRQLLRAILINDPAAVSVRSDSTDVLPGNQYDLIPSSDGYRRDRRLQSLIDWGDTIRLPVTCQLTRQGFASQSVTAPNAALWSDMIYLLHLAESRHVRLLFYLPNRLSLPEARLLPAVFNRLPTVNRVRINPDKRFDVLFKPTNSINVGHLNHNGARQYTALFVEAFKRSSEGSFSSRVDELIE